jgi:hypothetical protein
VAKVDWTEALDTRSVVADSQRPKPQARPPVNSYPIGEPVDRPEWRAARAAEEESNYGYLRMKDKYGGVLGLDTRHCLDDEGRLTIDGREFYLTPEIAAKLIAALKGSK